MVAAQAYNPSDGTSVSAKDTQLSAVFTKGAIEAGDGSGVRWTCLSCSRQDMAFQSHDHAISVTLLVLLEATPERTASCQEIVAALPGTRGGLLVSGSSLSRPMIQASFDAGASGVLHVRHAAADTSPLNAAAGISAFISAVRDDGMGLQDALKCDKCAHLELILNPTFA
jgi:hypothetical protein